MGGLTAGYFKPCRKTSAFRTDLGWKGNGLPPFKNRQKKKKRKEKKAGFFRGSSRKGREAEGSVGSPAARHAAGGRGSGSGRWRLRGGCREASGADAGWRRHRATQRERGRRQENEQTPNPPSPPLSPPPPCAFDPNARYRRAAVQSGVGAVQASDEAPDHGVVVVVVGG